MIGVIQFPGLLRRARCADAVKRVGEGRLVWHEETDLSDLDGVIVPGGFSYGDYLRAGAIARFSPAMEVVGRFAANGGAGARDLQRLPGPLRGRAAPRGPAAQRGAAVHLPPGRARLRRTSKGRSAGIAPGDRLSIPVKHTSGRYFAPRRRARPDGGQRSDRLPLRAGENPNGSVRDIAGVVNEAGNVLGLMPHPEHAVDPLTGSDDGLALFRALVGAPQAAAA